jgi:hypothetical protein
MPGPDYVCPGQNGTESLGIHIVSQTKDGCSVNWGPGTAASIQCHPLALCAAAAGGCQQASGGGETHIDFDGGSSCTRPAP